MYIPSHFAVDDHKKKLALIEAAPFGTLTTVSGGRLRTSTIPFLVGPDSTTLEGHIAHANSHWREFADATDLLVGFIGPNAYISPSWYVSTNMVPTWNYVAIEVRGRIELLDSPAARLDVVDRLSARHEASLPKPWCFDKMDPAFRDKLLDAIVAFRIEITSIEVKAKLSQNRRPEDVRSAAAALSAVDADSYEHQLASLMLEYLR